jgi:predicted lipoprotein with Yx(FWY)xxD motif
MSKSMFIGAAALGLSLMGAAPGADVVSAIDGVAAYVYRNDATASPTGQCRSACETAWPRGSAIAMPMDEGIGAIVHDDGVTQVAYDGRPVQFDASERKQGDVTHELSGDDVGSIWDPIRPAAHANPGAAYSQVTDDF